MFSVCVCAVWLDMRRAAHTKGAGRDANKCIELGWNRRRGRRRIRTKGGQWGAAVAGLSGAAGEVVVKHSDMRATRWTR